LRTVTTSRRRAFTLIEIAMVIVLIGIVAGFAVSRVNITGYRIDANIRLLQNALIGAQQTAITRNVYVLVMFDASSHRVRILQDADNDGTVSASETVTYRALDNARFLTPATTLDGALPIYLNGPGVIETGNPLQRAVRFAPNGALSGDAVLYIGSTSDRPDDMRALTIVGATGRTAFWSHGGGAWAQRNY
jgi:prepilin-type N-terminal cleavage/methylation domain-containing protein